MIITQRAMNRKEYWDNVYHTKSETDLSWTQPDLPISLGLIEKVCARGSVIDIGSGSSRLAMDLLNAGYAVTVLDISEAALERSQARLGSRAQQVKWIVADITTARIDGRFDVWHDRAVFHFLTNADDRAAYRTRLMDALPVGGHAIIATFALDGPARCSGLDVQRYDGPALALELGAEFELIETISETHHTPWGASQSFQYGVFKRV